MITILQPTIELKIIKRWLNLSQWMTSLIPNKIMTYKWIDKENQRYAQIYLLLRHQIIWAGNCRIDDQQNAKCLSLIITTLSFKILNVFKQNLRTRNAPFHVKTNSILFKVIEKCLTHLTYHVQSSLSRGYQCRIFLHSFSTTYFLLIVFHISPFLL